MPISLGDVASKAGVSRGTVSHVLNENMSVRITPETRERVRRIAQEMGYQPNAIARGLRRNRMDAIGVVMSNYNAALSVDPYYSVVLDGIISVASQNQQNVTLYTGHNWSSPQANLTVFRDRRVDGLLLLIDEADLIDALSREQMPFVVVGWTSPNPNVSCVDIDNVEAARVAVTHLLELGHRRIGMLCGADQSVSTILRQHGYTKALESAGLTFDPDLVLSRYYHDTWGYDGMKQLLSLPDPPTAVFAANDLIAAGVYRACEEARLKVPTDISVIGFDDTFFAALMSPQLTTMRQPMTQLGGTAMRTLLDLIQDISGTNAATKSVLPTELVIRGSTAAIHYPGEIS